MPLGMSLDKYVFSVPGDMKSSLDLCGLCLAYKLNHRQYYTDQYVCVDEYSYVSTYVFTAQWSCVHVCVK